MLKSAQLSLQHLLHLLQPVYPRLKLGHALFQPLDLRSATFGVDSRHYASPPVQDMVAHFSKRLFRLTVPHGSGGHNEQ